MPANPGFRIRRLGRSLFLTLALGATFWASSPAPAAQPVDRIVAVVNDEAITATELEQALQQAISELRQRMGPGNLPPRQVLRRQILDRLIIDRIQLQRAREQGIQVSAQEVDQAIGRVAQQNNMAPGQFRQALRSQGIDFAQYRQQLEEQILRSRLQDREVRSKVQVTDEEVESYLARQGQGGPQRYEYQLQHILVEVPEEASPEEADRLRDKTEELRERIRDGEQFGKVAAAESDGQNALEGGELGWLQPGELPAPVLAEVEAVEPGHLSRVVRTPSGFHLFKVTDRREVKSTEESQVKARQILLHTDAGRTEREAQRLAEDLLERVRTGEADFADLARQFSDGPSAQDGGALGWISRGEMVQPFEELVFSQEPGTYGGPVQTQDGIHIVEIQDKREKTIDPEDREKAAQNALRTRKTRERMDQWLRQLRAQAFVDIRLDEQ
ncbi:MAG: peptidylprolyl isomerase [Thiohalorhabdus sp.]|uniref:peptidylprolyl isomerase n=1 Tax=Thiohalorhabdus sp. TaxID=3094134 RepID=UPI00398146A8